MCANVLILNKPQFINSTINTIHKDYYCADIITFQGIRNKEGSEEHLDKHQVRQL